MIGYSLIEQPAIELFAELDWETANCFYESFNDSPSPLSSPKGRGINSGRETPYDVVLEPRLRADLNYGVWLCFPDNLAMWLALHPECQFQTLTPLL